VAALINISPDHLDRHGGEAGYIRAKRRIFADLGPGARAVIGVDDAPTEQICTEISANGLAARGVRIEPVSVGKTLGHGHYVLNGVLYEAGALHTSRIADLGPVASLRGRHNWQNAAIACACAAPFVADRNALAEGLVTFAGLAHRMELVAERKGVRFINDSKATNADAAARALACFERIYWIAGGRAKEGGIASLEPFFPRIARAYLIGEAAPDFAAALKGKVAAEPCGDMATAVAAAARDAAADPAGGAVVLLSPACASFDQYRDFAARGDDFRDCVAALGRVRGAA
jgi:UDP-N-acetylmuramoylalanine--D-glutamate ligase